MRWCFFEFPAFICPVNSLIGVWPCHGIGHFIRWYLQSITLPSPISNESYWEFVDHQCLQKLLAYLELLDRKWAISCSKGSYPRIVILNINIFTVSKHPKYSVPIHITSASLNACCIFFYQRCMVLQVINNNGAVELAHTYVLHVPKAEASAVSAPRHQASFPEFPLVGGWS